MKQNQTHIIKERNFEIGLYGQFYGHFSQMGCLNSFANQLEFQMKLRQWHPLCNHQIIWNEIICVNNWITLTTILEYWSVWMLYIYLRPGQTCHSKVMHRKEVTHSDGSYEKKSRRRTWLTIWDKVKSHGTGMDWCTGREWPVNCMTVISA